MDEFEAALCELQLMLILESPYHQYSPRFVNGLGEELGETGEGASVGEGSTVFRIGADPQQQDLANQEVAQEGADPGEAREAVEGLGDQGTSLQKGLQFAQVFLPMLNRD